MFKLQSYSLSLHQKSNVDCKCDTIIQYVLWLHFTKICGLTHCFMCEIWTRMISKQLFSCDKKCKNYTAFLGIEFFFMIPAWVQGNHVSSLYDYQDFIQIIYDLVWSLRILYDEQPGYMFLQNESWITKAQDELRMILIK